VAALAESPPRMNGHAKLAPAAFGCSRRTCVERGTACSRCMGERESAPAAPALTDGQASFILRTKLAHACVEGEAFESAWTFATAPIGWRDGPAREPAGRPGRD
jgi:hypothetical protein